MLEIVDNIYLFSASRLGFGDIIASRVRTGQVKKDTFSQFTLCEGEREFLSNALAGGRARLFAVMSKRDGEEIPLIFLRGFCGVEALGLVIELPHYDPSRLRSMLFNFKRGTSISPRVMDVMKVEFSPRLRKVQKKTEYFDTLGSLELLGELADFAKISLFEAMQEITRITGVKIEVRRTHVSNPMYGFIKQRLAGNESVAILFMMALFARDHSRDRALTVHMTTMERTMKLTVSFLCHDSDLSVIKRYTTENADCVSMIHSTTCEDGVYTFEFWPYVKDVSLVGLKSPDRMVKTMFKLGLLDRRLNKKQQNKQ